MRYHRDDVVRQALGVLDGYGLADLTMRRLAAELGVQPSALYHHVASKQVLLALVADEILARGGLDRGRPDRPEAPWHEEVAAVCTRLRDAVLAYRDGAEVVATVRAFGLGAGGPERSLARALGDADLPPGLAGTAARTLVHFVLGHAGDEQARLQADSAGALPGSDGPSTDSDSDFRAGLGLVLGGIRWRAGSPAPR